MTGTGLGFDLTGPDAVRKLMTDPSNLADLLTEPHSETDDSPAEIFADVVNIMRADVARIGAAVEADVEQPNRMRPERAGELLAGTVSGDGVELVAMFNKEAERRDKVLEAVVDSDEYEEFIEQKEASMFTGSGGD